MSRDTGNERLFPTLLALPTAAPVSMGAAATAMAAPESLHP
jgi:hypothetical protein